MSKRKSNARRGRRSKKHRVKQVCINWDTDHECSFYPVDGADKELFKNEFIPFDLDESPEFTSLPYFDHDEYPELTCIPYNMLDENINNNNPQNGSRQCSRIKWSYDAYQLAIKLCNTYDRHKNDKNKIQERSMKLWVMNMLEKISIQYPLRTDIQELYTRTFEAIRLKLRRKKCKNINTDRDYSFLNIF